MSVHRHDHGRRRDPWLVLSLLLRAHAEAVQERDCCRLDDHHHRAILMLLHLVLVGTSGILSLAHLVGAGPPALQRHYLVGSSTRPAAQCESRRAHGHHPYFLAFGGIMVVNLWSSYLSGSNVVDLLNNFFHSLGARAITILFCAEMHDSVLRLSRDALIWGRQLEGCNWLVQGHIRIHLKDRAKVHVSHESVHFLILAMVSGLMRVAARHCARPEV